MANVRAFRTGNWSDTTATSPWYNAGTLYAPASGDVVYANNFTVTVDTSQNIGSGTVTNAAATSILFKDGATANATAGGSFSLANGVTLTAATAQAASSGATPCILFALNSPNTATFVGNVIGGGAPGLNSTGSGTVNLIGNSTGGTIGGTFSLGVWLAASGTINITGNCYGGAVPSNGAYNNGTGTINITGNCYGSTIAATSGANNAGGGVINITGNCFGGSVGQAYGAINLSTGTLTITGNSYAGSVATTPGVINNGAGTVINNGVAFATATSVGCLNNSTGSFTLTKAVGNGYGPGTSGITSQPGAFNASTNNFYISQIQFGALGQTPIQGCFILTPSTSNTVQFYKSPALPNISSATWTSPTTGTIAFAANHGLTTGTQIVLSAFQDPTASWNGTFSVTVTSSTQVTISGPTSSPTVNGSATLLSSTKTLVDAAATAGVIPSASDVRSGVSYNAGSNIGTCAVPAAGSVALGVAVDNTTGTAILTAANVQSALAAIL